MNSNVFEEIFIRLVNAYVKKYNNHSFDIWLDEKQYLIGYSKEIIKVKFNNSNEILKRIFTEGSLGLGEAYCEGSIIVDDKQYKHFLMIFITVAYDKKLLFSLPFRDIIAILRAKFKRKFFEKNGKSENINSHYSLSDWFQNEKDANEFYLYWLNSEYIQYTCAKWDLETKTLEEAQINKLEFYANRLGIDKNSKEKTMLDLGCGWGGCMFFMAERYGIKCNGLTLSTAQFEFIKEEVKKRKLEDLITVEEKNVHEMKGQYDYVISIGLLEHISDYDDLYKKSSSVLKTGGKALFHAIFHTEMFYKSDPFLTKYIFPGGSTPEINNNIKVLKKYFKKADRNDLPKYSYPKTLDCWYDNFCENEDSIRKLLALKSKVTDIDFSIRVFKHYLMLSYCGLYGGQSLVANVLVEN